MFSAKKDITLSKANGHVKRINHGLPNSFGLNQKMSGYYIHIRHLQISSAHYFLINSAIYSLNQVLDIHKCYILPTKSGSKINMT